ncbi:hypothetical protein SGQ44_17120 [Flavobacterium sp. Fl-77]|uniref:Lipoprotein n=1 Tax=Flavobacterium flavipigmentatum TaxID=2893884 RepID=A0AAJ2VYR5_9FLAO|nr:MULTISPECIES: hypothetical protein [unclassified Flavobacterium]MDX6183951.1 hypothetical protein [Flavobacterium sp. Fl-33]MDX6187483.1 hypothetical protein [Flavobacterium sp. Fl-77]UFH37678.1 hypothetical protein LNP22_13125 [Flavobacterium sp. F-70]
MKNYKLIIGLFSSFCILTSCSNNRKIEITGYAYRNDKVVIFENRKEILNFKISGKIDEKKLCSFYESKLKIKPSNVELNFKIDSSGILVLDTCLVIPKEFKNPFVSIIYPSAKSKFKRKILLADDRMFVKD